MAYTECGRPSEIWSGERFFDWPIHAAFEQTATGQSVVYPWPWPVRVGSILPDQGSNTKVGGVMKRWLWAALPAFMLAAIAGPWAILPLGAIYVGTYYLRLFVALYGLPRVCGHDLVTKKISGTASTTTANALSSAEGGEMQRRFVGSSSRIVGSDREEHEWLDDTLAAKLLKFAGLALLTLGGLWIAIISQGSAGTVLGLASSAFFGGCAYLGLRRIFTKSNRLSKISQWQSRRDIMMAAESGDLETADALAAHDDSAGDAVFRPRVRRHRRPAIEADLPGATAAQTGSRRTS